MVIVVPVSNHDADLIEDFSEVVNFFGPYGETFSLFVVCRPSDRFYGRRIFEALKPSFCESCLHIFAEDGPIGWPEGPNFYWAKTAEALDASGVSLPWFWMEMDVTPIDEGWADALAAEYRMCGSPFLGVIEGGPSGKHLSGAAVYPPGMSRPPFNAGLSLKVPLAFDVLLKNIMVPMASDTKLIQNNFRTRLYQCTNQGLKGQDDSVRADGRTFSSPVRPGVKLVHGCQDGSLARLILNKERTYDE